MISKALQLQQSVYIEAQDLVIINLEDMFHLSGMNVDV